MKRSLLSPLVLFPLALLTPWVSAQDKSERDQALAAVKALRGTVIKFPFSISFDGKGITDDDLLVLQKLPDLQGLYLRRCKITDKGLERLQGLTKLKYLYLGNTAVTDKGLEYLQGMSRLESLSLVGTQVTDAGLAHLKGLSSLHVLELNKTRVTEAGIADLKKSLPNLVTRH